MPVSRVAATWNTARKCLVNSRLVNSRAASTINTNPVIVSVPLPFICLNITSAGPLSACNTLVNTILSQRCCAIVCNPRVPHRIASVHNSLACSVNFITDQPDARLIWMLFLCFFTDYVNRAFINLMLSLNLYRVGLCCTVYLHVHTIHNDP